MSHSDSHIPDDRADEILAEASRLQSEANSGYSREELQKACLEAGISTAWFKRGLHFWVGIKASKCS